MLPDGHPVEAMELSDRPFNVGVQYHPEFKSRPNRPHPLFVGLIEAALQKDVRRHGAGKGAQEAGAFHREHRGPAGCYSLAALLFIFTDCILNPGHGGIIMIRGM